LWAIPLKFADRLSFLDAGKSLAVKSPEYSSPKSHRMDKASIHACLSIGPRRLRIMKAIAILPEMN